LVDTDEDSIGQDELVPSHPTISCLSAWGFTTARDRDKCPLALIDAFGALRPLHDAPPLAVECGCRAVATLLFRYTLPSAPEALYDKIWRGGLPIVLEALTLFPHNASIYDHGLRAMNNSMFVSGQWATRGWLFEHGGAELTIQALRHFPNNRHVQLQAINVAGCFAIESPTSPPAAARLLELGAVGLVLRAMPPSPTALAARDGDDEDDEDEDEDDGFAMEVDEKAGTSLGNLLASCHARPEEWRQIVMAAAFALTELPPDREHHRLWVMVLRNLLVCGSDADAAAVMVETHGSGIMDILRTDSGRWSEDSQFQCRLWGLFNTMAKTEDPSIRVLVPACFEALRECLAGTRGVVVIRSIAWVIHKLRELPGEDKDIVKVGGSRAKGDEETPDAKGHQR
jgi:hypothetical protein